MKIVIITSPYIPVPPPKYGGTERIIYHLSQGLVKKGHQVFLLATGDSKVPGVNHIVTSPKALFFGADDKKQQLIESKVDQINQQIYRLLIQLAPHVDIIHSHGFDLKDFKAAPAVTTHHGKFNLENMDFFRKRNHLNFVSISNNQRQGYPDLNFVGTAYNGLDPKDFPVVLQPKDYLVFIGRFDREKNPHLAIELAIQLNMSIKLAGKIDFQGRDYFNKQIKPKLNHPLVKYLGEIGMPQKIKLISQACCNLHPTGFREPFGLTVLESAYCGTPTLAIARGSMDEIIENNRTGILVEDFAEGYHKIKDCLKLDRKYIATRSRALFNYQNMTQDYLSIYQQVIKSYYSSKSSLTSTNLQYKHKKQLINTKHSHQPDKTNLISNFL